MKKVKNGIDTIASLPWLKEGRLGLITNHSGVTKELVPSYEVLSKFGKLTALFSPEHGIYGAAQAGKRVDQSDETVSGAPVYSLYGGSTAPSEEQLKEVDVLCFDIQDVGARFYTYLYTMTRSMKAAAEAKIPFVVFDRCNPVGLDTVQGEILDERYASFVGEYAVPHRYGLTIGEFARYVNEEKGIGAELHVVRCEGLTRDLQICDTDLPWVAPSPNMPGFSTALAYTGTCIFEAVKNMSEGRGTTQPFELFGAPFVDEGELEKRLNRIGLDGVIFRRCRFVPTFSKFRDELCRGVQIHVTDRHSFSPFEAGVYIINTLSDMYELDMTLHGSCRIFGTSRLYDRVSPEEIVNSARADSEKFRKSTEKYFLY